jgi:hypothetical protein
MVVSVVISAGSLRTRWRTSIGEQRQQLKWVLFSLGVAGSVMLLSVVEAFVAEAAELEDEWITTAGTPLAWAGVMVAIGLASLRYRLYDVDLVINRTVVYAVTSLAVVAVYALVVVGVSSLLPAATDTGAALVAAAAVALAFAPVRNEIQHRVDRWMFGRRSDPVGVIADVGTTLASSDAPDAALQAIVDTVVVALKVPGASVELAGDSGRPRPVRAGDGRAPDRVLPPRRRARRDDGAVPAAHRPRTRGARADRRRSRQRQDRPARPHLDQGGRQQRLQHPHQAPPQ